MEKRIIILMSIIIAINVFIVFGSIYLYNTVENSRQEMSIGRYEFHKANDVNILILDTVTGEIWTKYIHPSGGNEEWTKDKILSNLIKYNNE